uniref:DNA/RNA helicase n=1 Tax=uncultured marine group II/III euryarchaeote KM3_83_G03 TaxID=1456522 RepID=A0A075HS87_9EURY|nr:DNA/RNA helicase [uncultured marine group II/III euryarchaeote KM3_83_G03]
MGVITDLHIHSRYSRACSKDLSIKNLEKWAKIKGVDVLGTGDFTHPEWLKELKDELVEDETGILRTKTGFPFMLTVEISQIYTDVKGRRIHNVITAPNFDVVDQITAYFLTHGRIDYDGRPIFKIPCPDLIENMRSISKDIEVIPAHVWTPWFSLFGSKSGFDSVEEAFKDQAKHIHALETGLSSDPDMNRTISNLDKYNLVSFSDSHSFWPWRLGREATIFDVELKYKNFLKALRTGKGLSKTIEVDPNYGKYHVDGHRACGVIMEPNESKKNDNICPVCKKELTLGVLHRVEALADREEPINIPDFIRLLPLSEIISTVIGKNLSTKSVWDIYWPLITKFGNEYKILLEAPLEELDKVVDRKIANAIILNREGKISVTPGYDGIYGVPNLNKHNEAKIEVKKKQKDLAEFF